MSDNVSKVNSDKGKSVMKDEVGKKYAVYNSKFIWQFNGWLEYLKKFLKK